MKFYGIYKITNLVNGKMYIGKHVTEDIDDGYMGSGKTIQRAIKKYGIENFRKEWLGFYEDEEELNYMERVFVDETWISRADTYNIKLGGEGGSFKGINKGRKLSVQHKLDISNSLIGKPHPHSGHSISTSAKTSISKAQSRAVVQMSKRGDVIAKFSSTIEAKKVTGINNIPTVCRCQRKSAGGFLWKYA